MQGGRTRAERSAATRAKILDSARERFAADGYERATIRAIASDAGIDPALVMRHYGNKVSLFAAAVDLDLHLPDLTGVAREDIGAVLISHFLDRWEQDQVLKALLRASATHEEAAARMRSISARQTLPLIRQLCEDPKSAPLRNDLINSQIWGFALARYVLRLPEIVALERADVVKWLAPTVQRYTYDQ